MSSKRAAPVLGGGLSNAFDVTPAGVATEMVVTTQPPSNIAAGGSFGLVVSVEDGFGAVDTSFNGNVTVALPSGSYVTLGGTLTVQAVNGVALLSNLTLDWSGSYQLSVTSLGLPPTTTSSIMVGNPFGGDYTGTMSGTATGPNGTESVSSSIGFYVSTYDGTTYLYDPVYGEGTVGQDGAVSITGSGSFGDLQATSFSSTGTAVTSSSGALGASGDWRFTDGSGSGTWSATSSSTVPLTPTINWSAPAAITYGTPLSTSQLDASASVPGTFSYLPAIGSVLAAGNDQTLLVTFTPTDTTDYTTVALTTTIDVNPATLTWDGVATGNWTDAQWSGSGLNYPSAMANAIVSTVSVVNVTFSQAANALEIQSSGQVAIGQGAVLAVTTDTSVTGGATLNIAPNGLFSSGGTLTLDTGGSLSGGPIAAAAYQLNDGTASANLSGPGGLTKATGGTVTLSGSNKYSGGTTVSDGLLVAENGAAIPGGSLLSIGPDGSVVLGSPGAGEPLAVTQSRRRPLAGDCSGRGPGRHGNGVTGGEQCERHAGRRGDEFSGS